MRKQIASKPLPAQQNAMTTMVAEKKLPEKIYVNSQNIQIALESFINRHRSTLQNQMEENHKLAQQNSSLCALVSNHEGTISALNESIAIGKKEIAKYMEEQEELIKSQKLLRSELAAYKKRCGEFMISSENKNVELQQKVDNLQQELKQRDTNEKKLKNELIVVQQELQAKRGECNNSNEELSKVKAEMNENKQQLAELEKSITNLQEELKQKDETIITIRQEQATFKIETEKNISKMQEVQRIFYPNATNPLPPRVEGEIIRPKQLASVSVQPRPQSRAALKRSSSSSSSGSDSDNENSGLLRGWGPLRNDDIPDSVEGNRGFERVSTDIPPTPESTQQPRRKRFRH